MTNCHLHQNDLSLFTEVGDKSKEKSLAGECEDEAGSFGDSRGLINHPGLSVSILILQKIVSKHVLLLSLHPFCFRFLEFSTRNKQDSFQVKMFHEKNPFQIDI